MKHNLDVVAGQDSWEKEETRREVEGYKWFGRLFCWVISMPRW